MRNNNVISIRPILDTISTSYPTARVVGNGSGNQTRARSRFITLIISTRFMARTNGADLLPSGFMFPALKGQYQHKGARLHKQVVAQNRNRYAQGRSKDTKIKSHTF